MDLTLHNQEVGTPDRGDGTVIGRNPANNKIVVRLKTQATVSAGQKSKTFNGWQFEYDESVLTPPEGKLKK